MLRWQDVGNQEVPPGWWLALEDHKRVLRAVIWAGWCQREPGLLAFLEGGAVLRVKYAESNVW